MCAKSQQSGDAVPHHTPNVGSIPSTLTVRKSRRVAPSVPVAAGEGFERTRPRSGAGQDGRPFLLSHGWRIKNPRSKPDPRPKGNQINGRGAALPFRVAAGVAPRGLPAGSCSNAQSSRANAMPKASPREPYPTS